MSFFIVIYKENKVVYINYEECKFLKELPGNYVCFGFILTMRNVNIIVNILSSFGIVRFILTMRNVNNSISLSSFSQFAGFILTMRNVNPIMLL